jgi:hypothetical protein
LPGFDPEAADEIAALVLGAGEVFVSKVVENAPGS